MCDLGPLLIKNCKSLSLPIKDYMRVILIIYTHMYKLMGNGGLWTWMHLYNCIGYTFPFSFITYKYNVPNKFQYDGVTKVVTPHSYELNVLTIHL